MPADPAERDPGRQRPPHLLTRRDVAAWLADSVVQEVTFPRTDPQSARDLIERGVDLTKSSADGAWGRGFYSGTGSSARYGPVAVPVAVRLRHPLILTDTIRGAEIVDDLMARFGVDDIEAAVVSAGFDGLVLHLGSSEMWVVAYRSEQVRIVVEETG